MFKLTTKYILTLHIIFYIKDILFLIAIKITQFLIKIGLKLC